MAWTLTIILEFMLGIPNLRAMPIFRWPKDESQ